MPRKIYLLAAALTLLPFAAQAEDAQRFDGDWQTTVSCPDSRGGLGFSFRFVSEVEDGVLHGLHGTKGEPGSLQIDGKIDEDGKANLYADGVVGSREHTPGRETPRGTEYGYHIDAHFDDTTGTGKRIEGRPCTVEFKKQK